MLLAIQHPGLVPFLTVLRATAQDRLGKHAAHFQPRQHADRESRRHVHVEAAVAVEVRGIRAVLHQPFRIRQEHRRARPVLAPIEDLRRFVFRRIERDLRRLEHARRAGREVVPEDRRGVQERRERVEHLRVARLPRDLHDRAERRQRHLTQRFAVERKRAELRICVVEIADDEGIVNDLRALDHIGRLRDQLLPAALFRMTQVHSDDAAAWSAVVCLKMEKRTGVSDEPVRPVEIVQETHDRRIELGMLGIAEILVVDAIAPVGAEPDGVDGVAAVGAHFDREPPVGMIRPLIDQPVG